MKMNASQAGRLGGVEAGKVRWPCPECGQATRPCNMVRHIKTTHGFWDRVQRVGDCLIWTGPKLPSGYGKTGDLYAHRVAYEEAFGPIATGLTIDHLCRQPSCVRPDHLEAVPIRVNLARGFSPTALNARKTHCKHGHPFDEQNTRIVRTPSGHGRLCRACDRIYHYRQDHPDFEPVVPGQIELAL